MTCEPSLSNCCWVIAEARFLKNIKFKVTTPRSKVKCQEFAYRCTLGLTGGSLIPTQIKSAKICKMTLTYIFNFQPQCHGQRSNIKIDMPRGNYRVRQHCKPNIKLLPFMVQVEQSRQTFCSEGHQVKIKGQIHKVTNLSTTACHDDVIYYIWTFFELWLLSNRLSKISYKHNVQGHHTKVKGQMSKICISLNFMAHREFIDTYTDQIWQNWQNDLDLLFQLSATVPRSKVKYQNWPA